MDTTVQESSMDARALREQLAGDCVVPGDPDWDAARQAWNRAVDQQPAAVALVETPDDVAAVVGFAREHGLRVAPQGTGHGAGALGDLGGTILLKTERMRGVEIDPERRTARVDAGVIWQEVADAADEHGLAVLAGSSPDVGVVGYTLGGGMSWLAREHGLSANSVASIDLVTGDGRTVRADPDTEPDLFWAVRGGGGNFGVVTSVELMLFPLAEVYAGWLIWPIQDATRIIQAWRGWTAGLPDTITSCARLLHVPPFPDIPEPFRGRSFVAVEAVSTDTREAADELLAGLRALGPELDTFATIRPRELSHIHMDPDQPTPGIGHGMLLDELPDDAIGKLVEAVDVGPPQPLLSVEIRHIGGALASARPEYGAVATLEGEFAMFALGVPFQPELAPAISAALDAIEEAFADCRCGRYFNFTERRVDASAIFPTEALTRLRRVKRRYDPDNVIRANHPIEPE